MQLDCAKAVAWPLPTRLSELSREFASYFLMLKGKQTTTAFEALWRSTVGRMAVVHAFLSVLRVICDPRAIAPGNADGTAALASGPTEKGLYKPTKAGSTANAIPGRANEICAGAAGILCRLFLRATGPQDSDLPIHICASIPAAAAEMVEELLRGGCLPMLSRVLASGPSASSGAPGFADSPKAGGTPCHFKAAADGATLVFNMVYSMVLVGVSQPRTRRLVLSPQLPACRLVERWAYAAANEASGPPRISHNNNHQLPPTDQESLDLNIRLLLSHHKPCKTQSMAHVMRSSMWLLLPALLWQRSDGGEPLRAVLSGPCLQYLVALQAVSQLHAADGGTLYGLPPAAVLPPELAEVEGRGQGPAVLCCDVLRKCVDFWESCVTGQPRVSLGPLRNRCLVNLCMRLSRVALASLEDAEATAAQPQTRKGGRSLQGQQQQRQRGQVGAEAGSNCSGGPPPASGVASVALRRPLEAGTCMSVALQSLRLAAATLRSMDAISSRGSSSAGGDGGTDGEDPSTASSCRSSLGGSSSTGSTSTSTSTSGAEASSSMLAAPPTSTDGGSSPRVAVADSSADTSPVAPEPSADPRLCSRSFGRRWWPLAVGAVRAALRHPGGMKEETLSTCCEVLRVSSEPQVWDPEQGTADWYKQVLELARTERQNLQEEDLEGSAAATEGDKLPGRCGDADCQQFTPDESIQPTLHAACAGRHGLQ